MAEKRIRVNFTMPVETKDKLKQYAEEHKTTASQVLVELIEKLKVKNPQIKGQQKFDGI